MEPTVEGWEAGLKRCFSDRSSTVHLFGVGNPLGRDDSVGLVIVSALRRRYGARPGAGIRIRLPALDPERHLSKLGGRERAVIFDAVECNRRPGQLFCARLSESRFGFFATHNVPLRLIPGLEESLSNAWVAGVQPGDVGVGEELSEPVRQAAYRLVDCVGRMMEERKDGRS